MSYSRGAVSFAGDARLIASKLRTQMRAIRTALLSLDNADVEDDLFTPGMLAEPSAFVVHPMQCSEYSSQIQVNVSSKSTGLFVDVLDFVYCWEDFNLDRLHLLWRGADLSGTGVSIADWSTLELDLLAVPPPKDRAAGTHTQWALQANFNGGADAVAQDVFDYLHVGLSRLGSPISLLDEPQEPDMSPPTLFDIPDKDATFGRGTSNPIVGGCMKAGTYLLLVLRQQLDLSGLGSSAVTRTVDFSHLAVCLEGRQEQRA